MGGEYLIGLNLLARILQQPPSMQFLLEMRPVSEHIFCWPGASRQSIAILQNELTKDLQVLANQLSEDHASLFTGPAPLVPLWESVWLERDRLLFGKRTLQIEELFTDWGISNARPDRDPLDHLGFELGFLAWILDLEQNEPDATSLSGQPVAEARRMILKDHIMGFAPQAFQKTAEAAQSNFYKIIAQNGQAMLASMCLLLDPLD